MLKQLQPHRFVQGWEGKKSANSNKNQLGDTSDSVCASPVAAEALHVVLAATLSRGDVALLGAAGGRASTRPWEWREKEGVVHVYMKPPDGAVGSLRV